MREASKGQYQPDRAPRKASVLPVSAMSAMSFVHHAFSTGSKFYMSPAAPIRGSDDMLSTTLGQHTLDYEPPRGFVIPVFAMFDGSTDPYDHVLHYNQAMILNTGNDRLCNAPTRTQCTFHRCGGPTLSGEGCHNFENFKPD